MSLNIILTVVSVIMVGNFVFGVMTLFRTIGRFAMVAWRFVEFQKMLHPETEKL